MHDLSLNERDRRWKLVRESMKKRGLEALVVWGSFGRSGNYNANLRYLSNARMEGYLVFPIAAEPELVTFSIHFRKPEQPWITAFQAGHPAYSAAIAQRMRELQAEKSGIGLVGLSGYYGEMGFPHAAYAALVAALPEARFEDATDIVSGVRMIKSSEEIRCFETGCEIANKVFETVANIAKIGAADSEVQAGILDTLLKNGCDAESMVMYCSGKEIVHAGQGQSLQRVVKRLEMNDKILTEFDAKFLGYKAQHNQPFSVGIPDKEWSRLFAAAEKSFNSGFQALRPGITAGELDEAFLAPIAKAGYTRENPAFHGLGLSLEEPIGSFPMQPSYRPDVATVMEAGMVLEFEPHVVTPDIKKGVHLGCPVILTETGCRLLNDKWQPEFKVV